MDYDTYKNAHAYASYNREALKNDKICGCFFCLNIFSPKEITDYCNEYYIDESNSNYCDEKTAVTALCPHCYVDAIIGESSGYLITEDLLKSMNYYAFIYGTSRDTNNQ